MKSKHQHSYFVIPGQPAGLNPEPKNTVVALLAPSVFLGSGFLAEFILGPAKGRTRGLGPRMTERGAFPLKLAPMRFRGDDDKGDHA